MRSLALASLAAALLGGVAPAAAQKAGLAPDMSAYEASFERIAVHWITPTGGCRDARTDMLGQAASSALAWSQGGCAITAGVWRDAISGATLTQPRDIILTHTVPLSWAEARGASAWSPAQRAAFFTDRDNLLTVSVQTAAHLSPSPLVGPWPASAAACARTRAFSTVVQRHGLVLTGGEAAALRAALEETCATPAPATVMAHRRAQDASIQAARAAFDAIHGVTPAERAAGPDPKPASYPEGRHIPTVVVPALPNPLTGEVPARVVPVRPGTPNPPAVLAPQRPPRTTAAADAPRPPIALPGAYRAAPPARATAPAADTPTADNGDPAVGLGVGGFGIDPTDQGGEITSAEELVDVMAEEMEARGIMPPGFAPGTAPDANEIMRRQGIDPSQYPGFDGDPTMLGLGAGGTSITVSP